MLDLTLETHWKHNLIIANPVEKMWPYPVAHAH